MTRNLNAPGSVMMLTGLATPCWRRNVASSPVPPSICWKMVTTSTQEKKCGSVTTAWMNARSRRPSRLSSRMASAIGAGKNSTNWTENSTRVLLNACQNAGSVNNCWKLAKPTQGLWVNPSYRS